MPCPPVPGRLTQNFRSSLGLRRNRPLRLVTDTLLHSYSSVRFWHCPHSHFLQLAPRNLCKFISSTLKAARPRYSSLQKDSPFSSTPAGPATTIATPTASSPPLMMQASTKLTSSSSPTTTTTTLAALHNSRRKFPSAPSSITAQTAKPPMPPRKKTGWPTSSFLPLVNTNASWPSRATFFLFREFESKSSLPTVR